MTGPKVGATTMDRPEWAAAHPTKAEVYCCLTHNRNRGMKPNTAATIRLLAARIPSSIACTPALDDFSNPT